MAENTKPKKKFAKKLLHKYRMVVLNEDTFEERFSFRLTRLNVFVAVGISAILLIAMTTFLIAILLQPLIHRIQRSIRLRVETVSGASQKSSRELRYRI